MSQTVSAEKFINAPIKQVYHAFTNATVLREWLCDLATISPHPGGRMYLWWQGEYSSNGEYITLEENKSITFNWLARTDPGSSQVTVNFQQKDSGTRVTLVHTVPDGAEWTERARGFQNEWENSLENLASVMETGLDLRAFNRPMLGIEVSDFNVDIALQLGVPVTNGLRMGNVLEGLGAYAAGLRKDDVIVSLGGSPITNDYSTVTAALQGNKSGDKLEVVFYRGREKITALMELSRRPVPKIPFDAAILAQGLADDYEALYTELSSNLAGVSEAEASSNPSPREWSVKEILAHLIQCERYLHFITIDLLVDQEKWSDDWSGNVQTHITATLAAFPTLQTLLEELKRLLLETRALVTAFPPEFVARKGSYFRAAEQLHNFKDHALSHIDQVKTAVRAAKKG